MAGGGVRGGGCVVWDNAGWTPAGITGTAAAAVVLAASHCGMYAALVIDYAPARVCTRCALTAAPQAQVPA